MVVGLLRLLIFVVGVVAVIRALVFVSKRYPAAERGPERAGVLPTTLAIVAGTAYVLIVSGIPEGHDTLWRPMGFALVTLTPVLVMLAAWSRQRIGSLLFFLHLGLWLGVVVDVARDTKERNLFPLEMVAWSVLAMPSVLLGVAIVWAMHRIRRA
jgi:hypothetical protein